jgi:hypothetical protein
LYAAPGEGFGFAFDFGSGDCGGSTHDLFFVGPLRSAGLSWLSAAKK